LILDENIKKSLNKDEKVIENQILEDLKREKERLELTIESFGDGLITIDCNGLINTINKSAEILTEWDRKNAIGMELCIVFNLIDGKNSESINNILMEDINKESYIILGEDSILVSKTGKEVYISGTISNIIDDQNNIIGIVILFRDITKIKTW